MRGAEPAGLTNVELVPESRLSAKDGGIHEGNEAAACLHEFKVIIAIAVCILRVFQASRNVICLHLDRLFGACRT
jgi:hypothetical protein